MKLLLFLRALKRINFYNWDTYLDATYELVLRNLADNPDFNLGQKYEVMSVNRTTGKICMRRCDG